MEIQVPAGDFEKIIDDIDAEDEVPYLVEVVSGQGRLVHSREEAVRGNGDRIFAGDRTTIDNLRSDSLFASAESTGPLVLNVSRASADIDFQERTDDMTIGTVREIDTVASMGPIVFPEDEPDPHDTSNEPDEFDTYQGKVVNTLEHIKENTA